MGTSRHPLLEGFCGSCKPADRRPPWQWCEEHVHVDETSPLPGRWRSDASPWVRAVMEDFANNTIRDIAVQCAAQSAKTQTVMNCACWAIAEDPGPAMWVTATKDELRDFLRDRLTPTFETCRPVKERMAEPTLAGFAFDGMPFYAGWSGSKARLQSKPIRWLFCDEVRNYPPGRLEMVLKRTRSFWNSRRFLISTPGTKGDAMDTAYRAGDQRVWQFTCPQCQLSQLLKFEQLKGCRAPRCRPL
ncbi:MAG: phage terminase large subunit family protein [Limisphaerales bacterium]